MSTRRARIKAVTSLPPRRKNADTTENKVKNNEKKNEDFKSLQTEPTAKPEEAVQNTDSESNILHVNFPKVTSPKGYSQSTAKKVESPKKTVKPLVSSSVIKSTATNVFLSPQRRDSPRRTFASPYAPSPKPIKSLDLTKTTDTQKSVIKEVAQNGDFNELIITDTAITKINHAIVQQNTAIKLIDRQNDSNNDDGMDGIVPLQSDGGVPKPIDLLKSEIISENAEVLFDPIVPLPSPSKVRPKLKPAPRLGPHRRNSIQGSASESEDESRRNLVGSGSNTPAPARQRYDSHTPLSTMISLPNRDVSRVRNDSICSTVSQVTTVQPAAASPVKEKHMPKVRRPEVNRRLNASRRRRDLVKREALTMYDLIFYNPTSNPLIPDQDELKAKEENEKDIAEQTKKEEAEKDEPEDLPEEDAAPVPQIKLGPNGEIILDEKSLVIKQTGSAGAGVRGAAIREGAWSGGGGRYRRATRSADWAPAETVRFYRALAALGTDFTLMAPLFPGRARNELKLKFKKEEKLNGAQVDKALRSATGWDVVRLGEEFKEEREEAVRRAENERERLLTEQREERARLRAARATRVRSSKGSKAIETRVLPGLNFQSRKEVLTADDIIERAKQPPRQPRREINKIPITLLSDSILNMPPAEASHNTDYATLTLLNDRPSGNVKIPESDTAVTVIKNNTSQKTTPPRSDMAIIAKVNSAANSQNSTPVPLPPMPQVPSNIETGSLVVLTVNDPTSPGKKMLQTYIAHGQDKLTPVALPATFLNSVVGYMKKNSLKGSSAGSSPLLSPNSVANHDSRTSPSISVFPSPVKRQRNSSYTITHL